MNHTLATSYSSARSLFSSGYVRDTSIDQQEFLRVYNPGEGTYSDCGMQKPGFNVECLDDNNARFGYCANCPDQTCQTNDNDDSDAVIGIGLSGQYDLSYSQNPTQIGG